MKKNFANQAAICAALCLSMGNVFAETTIKIGFAGPLTGAMAQYGKESENGARLAIEEINERGLVVNGNKIRLELDSMDDANDPKTATQIAQRLVDDHVVAVVGHQTSGTSIPASQIYNDAGVVQISYGATNPTYTKQGFKTAYRVVTTDDQQGPAIARFAANSLKIQTVAIIDDQTAYGQGLADSFESAAKAAGIKILSRDAVSPNSIDFRGVLTKLKGEKPDAIMYGGLAPTGGPMAKQARQLNLRVKILGGDGMCPNSLVSLAGTAADDVICSIPGVPLASLPRGKIFAQKFEKRFSAPVQMFEPYAYDAVYVVAEAMKRSNSTDSAKILASLPLTSMDGVTGKIQFTGYGDLIHGTVTIYNYVSGVRKPVPTIGS